jgi:hypothetical protein
MTPADVIRETCGRCGSKPSAETRNQKNGQDWCNVCWDRVQPLPAHVLAALEDMQQRQADINGGTLVERWRTRAVAAEADRDRLRGALIKITEPGDVSAPEIARCVLGWPSS